MVCYFCRSDSPVIIVVKFLDKTVDVCPCCLKKIKPIQVLGTKRLIEQSFLGGVK